MDTGSDKHIQTHAEEAGCPRLKTATKPWLQKYLKKMDIKPFKIKYYLERKDPGFENKMHDVLLVYKQVEMQLDDDGTIIIPDNGHLTHTVSYDEKPGIQAIANKYPHHDPTEGSGYVRRDYEYVRLGTLSLLAGIDLLTGGAIPLVSQTHKSSNFIGFLKILDAKYPEEDTIRLILYNHSAHTSRETQQFPATLPKSRFVFMFTPTHMFWLNMIESFFSKMTKQMLKGIRVNSKEELSEQIYHCFDEINADPIVYHWTYKRDEIDPDEAATHIQFSTNHEGLSQPEMKMGDWLHYCLSFLSCFIIVPGRIKFGRTLEDLHPVFQRKCFALEHSILSHLLWVARVAKSVSPRANLLPIRLQRRCSV